MASARRPLQTMMNCSEARVYLLMSLVDRVCRFIVYTLRLIGRNWALVQRFFFDGALSGCLVGTLVRDVAIYAEVHIEVVH